jgi:hypothetical protein
VLPVYYRDLSVYIGVRPTRLDGRVVERASESKNEGGRVRGNDTGRSADSRFHFS